MNDPQAITALLSGNRTIPVVTFARVEDAVPVGHALAAGGVTVIEVTLRTAAGLQALRRLRDECPDLILGAGTVLDARQAREAVEGGARFLVSPGHTSELIQCAKGIGVPWMLGATTLSEIMTLREHGFLVQKFFPAEPSGGIAALKAIGSVLPDVAICPTGGISAVKAASYLELPNIIAVGGSWFVPPGDLDVTAVTDAARHAAATFKQVG